MLPRARRGPLTPSWLRRGLIAAGLAGVGLRAWVYFSSLGQLDADEAVWGLMAKHALDGELSVFLWGQPYGGTLEPYMSAPLYALIGPHKITVELIPILLTVASAWVVWRIGKRVMGEPGASIAAALYWVWPAYVMWKSTKGHGFYGTGLLLALLAVLLVVRLGDELSLRDAGLLGLVLGLGLWTSHQTVLYALPLLAWLVVWRPRILRYAPVVAAGAILGALPWLVYNLQHDWSSVQGAVVATSLGDRLEGAFRNGLPAILGLRVSWSQEWIPTPWVGRGLYVAVLAAFGWLSIRGRWGVKMHALFLIALAYPFLFALSPQASYVHEPRYFYFLTPVVALLVAKVFSEWTKATFYAVLLVAVMWSASGLALIKINGDTSQGAPDVRLPTDVGPVADFLEEQDVDHFYANYWLAHLVTYWTDERVVGVADGGVARYEPHAAAAAADPKAARVFVAGTSTEAPYVDGLKAAGASYERHEVDGFVVYIPII